MVYLLLLGLAERERKQLVMNLVEPSFKHKMVDILLSSANEGEGGKH